VLTKDAERFDVFISYRWEGGAPQARLICENLNARNWPAFLDVEDLRAGHIDESLLKCIAETPNFVVILSPNALDRCSDPHDWLRLEIAEAIRTKKNIVPVLLPGFSMPADDTLPADLHGFGTHKGVDYSNQHFKSTIDQLVRHLRREGVPRWKVWLKAILRWLTNPGIQPIPFWGIVGALLLAAGILFWYWHSNTTVQPTPQAELADPQFVANRDSFLGALPWLHWVVYDPSESNPDKDQGASESSIRSDLQVLRQHHFDGLITMTSKGTWQHIPRIAHEEGFTMVIMGIWELRNEEETNNALSASKYADAYCLGHSGLNKRYLFQDLESWAATFRSKAKRPVTTSSSAIDYETDPKLAEFGDFMFPSALTQWQLGKTPEAAWAETLDLARRSARLAVAAQRKIVLLKMVSYPSGGAPGLSPHTQAEFYRLAVDKAKDRNDIPAGVSFSFLAAFDPAWKNDKTKWEEAEQYTGLFTKDRQPKLAITEVTWRKPH
jgi:exo-beta-1,3-glucanase (GH17 family)